MESTFLGKFFKDHSITSDYDKFLIAMFVESVSDTSDMGDAYDNNPDIYTQKVLYEGISDGVRQAFKVFMELWLEGAGNINLYYGDAWAQAIGFKDWAEFCDAIIEYFTTTPYPNGKYLTEGGM